MLGLLEFIPTISPEFTPPWHLDTLGTLFALMLRNVRGELERPVRALISYPIRHRKTETILHGVLWLLAQDPTLRIVIMSYNYDRVKFLGKRLKSMAKRTQYGPTRGYDEIHYWQNDQGGGVLIMSPDQSREGFDCHVLICDDPIDENQARLADSRDLADRTISYYSARCMRNGKPGPVLIVMSRQHVDDPIGRREARRAETWDRFYQPAIIHLNGACDHEPRCKDTIERAFAPDVWPLEELKKLRAIDAESDPTEKIFWSRFQGVPREDMFSQFREPVRYLALPSMALFGHGIDMSWTASKHSDKTALIAMARCGSTQYVLDVVSMRFDFEAVESTLRSQKAKWPGQIFSYVSGPEVALAKWAAMRDLRIVTIHASSPKFVRGRGTVDRWNAGMIQVPQSTHFPSGMRVESFVNMAKRWTGNEGEKDDEIDALVSVSDALTKSSIGAPRMIGKRRMG